MLNKIITTLFIFILILIGCDNNKNADSKNNSVLNKLTVYYLHPNKSCATCKEVGVITQQTMQKYFLPQLKKGQILFSDINISRPENDSIANKFQCNWSGLYLLLNKNGEEISEDLTKTAFMYALNNPDTLEYLLKLKINEKIKLL